MDCCQGIEEYQRARQDWWDSLTTEWHTDIYNGPPSPEMRFKVITTGEVPSVYHQVGGTSEVEVDNKTINQQAQSFAFGGMVHKEAKVLNKCLIMSHNIQQIMRKMVGERQLSTNGVNVPFKILKNSEG